MPVYLDHAATTPMLPEAIDAYTAALSIVGNPSSIHSQGQNARRMLEEAREHVATSLGCDPIEVVFTSGGTESVNLAVKGLYWARNSDGSRNRILVPRGSITPRLIPSNGSSALRVLLLSGYRSMNSVECDLMRWLPPSSGTTTSHW